MEIDFQEFEECDAPIEGYYSETDQYWIIRPKPEWAFDPERNWLCIGGPGVDGIEFGYLKNKSGVFAYYPIDDEFVFLAKTSSELVSGWIRGKINV